MTDSSEPLGSPAPDPLDPLRRFFRAGFAVLTILMGLYIAYTAAKWLFPLQKLEAVDPHLKLRQDASGPSNAWSAAKPAVPQSPVSPAAPPTAATRPTSADAGLDANVVPAAPGSDVAAAAPASAISESSPAPIAAHAPQAFSGRSALLAGGEARTAEAGRSAALSRSAPPSGPEAGSSRQQTGQPSRRTTGNTVAAKTNGDFLQRAPAPADKPAARSGSVQVLDPFPTGYRGGLRVEPAAPGGRQVQNPVLTAPNGTAAVSAAKGPDPVQSNIVQSALQASASLQAKGAYLAARSGLCPSVALAWVVKENGVNNNILGVTGSNGLNKYATWQEGIDAAVALLRTSSYYNGITAAIASGNCCAQRDAIVASPWSGASHYGHGANFPNVEGCRPYGQ